MNSKGTRNLKTFDATVRKLGGRPVSAYGELTGACDYGDFTLIIDDIPPDPTQQHLFLRARISFGKAGFPPYMFTTKARETALRDFLVRTFHAIAGRQSVTPRGGTGGRIAIDRPGQEMLESSAMVVSGDAIEARFTVELPVRRGRIDGDTLIELFMSRVPRTVRASLVYDAVDGESLGAWLETAEDAHALRESLDELGLVSFVANKSMLPKRNTRNGAPRQVLFTSPPELAMIVDLPNRGRIRGMGIPRGMTVITGALGSGKSTLLRAVELGVYNHIPGDGREMTVTIPDAVSVHKDPGRPVQRVDVSPFFSDGALRGASATFSVSRAGEAVSQAAGIVESLDMGARALLFDEDTSAASLLFRDGISQAVLPPGTAGYHTLVDVLPHLRDDRSVSSVMVTAGGGDFIRYADTVIRMETFRPRAITGTVQSIVASAGSREREAVPGFPAPSSRRPLSQSMVPSTDTGRERPRLGKRGIVQYGDESIDLSAIGQLVNQSQARGIMRGMALLAKVMDGSGSLKEAVDKVMERIDEVGLDTLSNRFIGDLARFRPYELAAAVNRLRNLTVK